METPGCCASRFLFIGVRSFQSFRAAFRRTLQKTKLFAQVPAKVWSQEWVAHCKPVGEGQATQILAPYIHRVAISNRRLIAFDDRGGMETSQVTFQYRTSDTRQLKTCTLSVEHSFSVFSNMSSRMLL